MPRRLYRDDVVLSIIGFGGLMLAPLPQKDVDGLVAWALDRGVNYFDIGPTYPSGDIGLCERRLGMALGARRAGGHDPEVGPPGPVASSIFSDLV